MKLLLLSILLYVPTLCYSFSDWTQEQKNWFIASNIAIVADWATTRDMSKRYHEGFREFNIIMGPHPSTQRVDTHFASVLLLNYLGANYFQGQNKILYLQVITGVHGTMAARNMSIGLRLQF